MTQEQPERKPRAKPATPDEGEAYTRAVMREVKHRRQAKDWSAERLAEEMAKIGVPWTRDTVTNLELGRRKRIAAHEVLALAWVLELSSPVDLLAPGEELDLLQVTPQYDVPASVARDWFAGKLGPLKNFENRIKSSEKVATVIVDAMVELRKRGYSDEEIGGMLNETLRKVNGTDGRLRQVAPEP